MVLVHVHCVCRKYLHICAHVCVHLYMYAYTCRNFAVRGIDGHIHVCITYKYVLHTNTNMYIHIASHTYLRVFLSVCARYDLIFTHTYIYTHIHICRHARSCIPHICMGFLASDICTYIHIYVHTHTCNSCTHVPA